MSYLSFYISEGCDDDDDDPDEPVASTSSAAYGGSSSNYATVNEFIGNYHPSKSANQSR